VRIMTASVFFMGAISCNGIPDFNSLILRIGS